MRARIGAGFAAMLLVFLIGDLAHSSAQTALSGTQSQMQINCSSFRDLRQAAGSDIVIPDGLTAGICWGAFLYVGGIIQVKNGNGEAVLAICAPESTQINQLINTFLDYADWHPELGDRSFVYSTQMALAQAFPCAGRKVTIGEGR